MKKGLALISMVLLTALILFGGCVVGDVKVTKTETIYSDGLYADFDPLHGTDQTHVVIENDTGFTITSIKAVETNAPESVVEPNWNSMSDIGGFTSIGDGLSGTYTIGPGQDFNITSTYSALFKIATSDGSFIVGSFYWQNSPSYIWKLIIRHH